MFVRSQVTPLIQPMTNGRRLNLGSLANLGGVPAPEEPAVAPAPPAGH